MPRAALYATTAVVAAALSFVVAAARPGARGDTTAADGAALFVAKGCSSCHEGPANRSLTGVGPSLVAAATWAGERIAGVAAADYLEQSMRSPSAFISPAYRPTERPVRRHAVAAPVRRGDRHARRPPAVDVTVVAID